MASVTATAGVCGRGAFSHNSSSTQLSIYLFALSPPPVQQAIHYLGKMKLKEDLNPILLLLFHLMVWIYTFITFLPFHLLSWLSGPDMLYFGSEEEQAQRMKALSILGCPEGPYRAVSASKRLVTSLHPAVDTLDKMFEYAVLRFPHRDCLGTREVISEEDEQQSNGKVFKKVCRDSLLKLKRQTDSMGKTGCKSFTMFRMMMQEEEIKQICENKQQQKGYKGQKTVKDKE